MENAQLSLAEIYLENCDSENYEEAFICLQKIVNELQVNQELGFYQQELGDMYFKGEGVTEDIEQAVYWYKKAAKNNYDLFKRYSTALVFPILEVCNEIWLIANKTAEIGYSNAELFLGLLYLGSLKPQNQKNFLPKESDHYSLIIELFNDSILNVEQNFEKAFFWLNRAANQGLAQAQAGLGYMYQKGFFVKQDFEAALNWYEKAAEQNDSDAQANLAAMYLQGHKQAISWIDKAATQGQSYAQYLLGQIYASEEDEDKFLYWCLQAAEQNHIQSQMEVAVFYESQDEEESKKQAFYWYQRAAEQGHTDAFYCIAGMFLSGEGVHQDDKQALDCLNKAAHQGNVDAQELLGQIYFEQENYENAFFWFNKVSKEGNSALAEHFLGSLYYNGLFVEQSYEQAFFWHHKAAKQGILRSQIILSEMYLNGTGTEKSCNKAFFWIYKFLDGEYVRENYEKAWFLYGQLAEQGYVRAQYILGAVLSGVFKDKEDGSEIFELGKIVEQDMELGMSWLHKAADQELAGAQYALSLNYFLKKDDEQALIWLTKAAEQGHAMAQNELGRS